MRRLRATFLLQFVVAVVCLGLLAAFVALFGNGMSLLTFGAIAVFCVLGLELGVLPWLLERCVVTWAERRAHVGPSRWFVDLVAEDRRRTREADAGRDNPSLW